MSSYDIRPALRVDRLFQLLLATLADMAIEAIENSSWRRHLIHANRAFRSSWWLVGNVTGSEYAEFVEYAEYAKYAKFAKFAMQNMQNQTKKPNLRKKLANQF